MSTPGTATPSSEALDVVSELPLGQQAPGPKLPQMEPNGNMTLYDPLGPNPDPNMSVPLLKQYQPAMLNGNANSTAPMTVGVSVPMLPAPNVAATPQDLEDLYAKVSYLSRLTDYTSGRLMSVFVAGEFPDESQEP